MLKALAVIATIVGWWQFAWPPIAFYRKQNADTSFGEVVWELVRFKGAIYDEPILGWIFILVTAALVVVLIQWVRAINDYFQNSRVGISVLETEMEVVMHDAARSMATIKRRQTFHANRSGITAYRLDTGTDTATGRIIRASMTQESQVANKVVTKELIMRGGDSNLEVIETFDRELPRNVFATYLPNWFVCALHKAWLFDNVVVTRTGEVNLQNEFDGPEGVYSVNSTKYPISRTNIRVSFVAGAEPSNGNIRGFLIRENVVEDIALTVSKTSTHVTFEARASSLHMESLRIQWQF
ncbi:hypothetical protein [Brevundimonas sp.]|uniref:hypothetical protein n=1 Tax=Brevundimonas sp. TaxID=1871086 RepID=UPI003D6D3FDE